MPDQSPHGELEELLEATWAGRDRRLGARERRFEGGLSAAFLLGAALLALGAAPAGWHPGLLLIALVAAYAAASLVLYPLGVADLVPTQPFLVIMFALAPAAVVPLLVWAGLALGRLVQTARGQRHAERMLLSGGDAIHALGPALVFVALGHLDAAEAAWPVWIAAFVAQVLLDNVAATLREGVVHRVRPQLQVPILAQVAALDAALLPVGIFAVLALDEARSLVAVGLLPLVGLLAYTARDRAERTSRLSTRLQALQRERRRLQVAVQRIGEAFASNLDLDALLEITTRAAVEALNADAGRASAFQGGARRLVRRIDVGEEAPSAALLERAELAALDRPGVVELTDSDASAVAFVLDGDAPAATVAIARTGSPFSEEERALFAYLCEQASVAATNVSRHEALHRQALTDELTGLANHRRLQELLSAACERHRRTGAPAALVLLDLDHFKLVNDIHGHQTGDKVLRAVGRRLRAECRASDEPARYGGEELAVVLGDTTLERAAALAERFRGAIASLDLTGPEGERLAVTVSVGVAVLGDDTPSSAALIAAADAALYDAKLNGRNRVEVHSPAGSSARPRVLSRAEEHKELAELATTLARALDTKQPSIGRHSDTVAHFSALIAEALGLDRSRVYRIWLAGLIHDIGKVGVPGHILDKPGPLTSAEYAEIKRHSERGEAILAGTVLAEQGAWIRQHHERVDGGGYPDGIAGEDIALEARIIHVADAFEAMIADRPYRRGMAREAAARELRAHAGTQFDPVCVDVLLSSLGLGAPTSLAARPA